MEFRGRPAIARVSPQARDRTDWRRLWNVSEELTGQVFPALV
jgi:hypothetical protein